MREGLKTNNMVSCQVEGRRMQYSRCGSVWGNIRENRIVCGIYRSRKGDGVPRRREVLRRTMVKGVPHKYI